MSAMSVSQTLGAITESMNYDTISQESREIAKRLIIDALACGVGGYQSPTGGLRSDMQQEFRKVPKRR